MTDLALEAEQGSGRIHIALQQDAERVHAKRVKIQDRINEFCHVGARRKGGLAVETQGFLRDFGSTSPGWRTNGRCAFILVECICRGDIARKTVGQAGTPANYRGLDLSPDGKRIAVYREEGQGGDIWVLDLTRGTTSRFTSQL